MLCLKLTAHEDITTFGSLWFNKNNIIHNLLLLEISKLFIIIMSNHLLYLTLKELCEVILVTHTTF